MKGSTQALDNSGKVQDEIATPHTEAATDLDININEAAGGANPGQPETVEPDVTLTDSQEQESIETLEPGSIQPSSNPSQITVQEQPLRIPDPLKRNGFRFVIDGWALEVYSARKKNQKRFLKVLGIVENPGEVPATIQPIKDGDALPLKLGFVFTIQGWAYTVTSVRSRQRRFVKRLGTVTEEIM